MLRKILVSFAIAAIAFALGGALEAAHAAKPNVVFSGPAALLA